MCTPTTYCRRCRAAVGVARERGAGGRGSHAAKRISKTHKKIHVLSPEDARLLAMRKRNPSRKQQLTSGLALPGLLRPPCAFAVITILHTHRTYGTGQIWMGARAQSSESPAQTQARFLPRRGKLSPKVAACRAEREINQPKLPVDQCLPRCCVLCAVSYTDCAR